MLTELGIPSEYDGFVYLAEATRNPPMLPPHRHRELELNLVARGEITYVVSGRRITFGPRSLLWMFPSQTHQLVDRSADARYYVAVFKSELIRRSGRGDAYRSLRQSLADDAPPLRAELPPPTLDFVVRSIDELLADGPDPDTLNREAGFGAASDFHYRHDDPDWLNAGLRHLLLLCWRHQLGHQSVAHDVKLHPGVERALAALRDPNAPTRLGDLARLCGVSPSYLSRTFRRQVGVSLTRYRNSVRLARFWEAYRKRPHEGFLQAVYAADFGSYAQFYRIYRDVYGAGPRESLAIRGSDPD